MQPNSSIDILIFDKNEQLTLLKREQEPFSNQFALIGGAQLQFESFDSAIERILKQKVGFSCKVSNLKITHSSKKEFQLKQLQTYDSGNDPRGGNTTLFLMETNFEKTKLLPLFTKGEIQLFEKNNIPNLAFEHNKFISNFFFHEKNYTTKKEQDIAITIDIAIMTIQNNFIKILLSKRTKKPYLL